MILYCLIQQRHSEMEANNGEEAKTSLPPEDVEYMSYDPGRIRDYYVEPDITFDPARIRRMHDYDEPDVMTLDSGQTPVQLKNASSQTAFKPETSEDATPCVAERREVIPLLQNPVLADVRMPYDPENTSLGWNVGRMTYDPDRIAMDMAYDPDRIDTGRQSVDGNTEVNQRPLIRKAVDRFFGILDIPLVLVFGIILYLVDVGSDILAAVDHFQEGHPIWGSLTVTFVILPAICWAAVSWMWWYTHEPDDSKGNQPSKKESRKRTRRMLLAILLLDPLTR